MSILNPRDRENLTAYLDGELDPKSAQALEAKINLDPEARKEVEALKQAWGMLDYLPKAQPTAGFTHRTLELLSQDKKNPAVSTGAYSWFQFGPWLRAGAWSVGILVAVGAGLAGGNALFKKAPDTVDSDEPIVRHLRVLDKWRQYDTVGDVEFLKALNQPELFGDEQGS